VSLSILCLLGALSLFFGGIGDEIHFVVLLAIAFAEITLGIDLAFSTQLLLKNLLYVYEGCVELDLFTDKFFAIALEQNACISFPAKITVLKKSFGDAIIMSVAFLKILIAIFSWVD
jgi:hypothetical protein